MARPSLHQFIVGATPGDAITGHALLLQRWLREDGFYSELFAEGIHADLRGQVLSYLAYRPSHLEQVVILHHSIGSAMVDHLLAQRVRFVLIYHNVTPPDFFHSADPVLVKQLETGRAQLAQLRARTILALGISLYDESELREAGFAKTGVLPIPLRESDYNLEPNSDLQKCYSEGGPNLLFVGRLSPNKRQEDLIKLLYFYRRIAPAARLFLVGSPWMPEYADWLQELADELGLGAAVIFAGHVSQQDLVTYYRLADVFVSMSEHEGFGKPLIESMYFGVPVLAHAAAAVPETMGDAGILFHRKDYEALAEVIDLLVCDESLRQRIIARQHERVQSFSELSVRRKWNDFLTELDRAQRLSP